MKNIKVTALIPDELVSDVKDLANGQNLTDCLITALSEWTELQKIKKLNDHVRKKPLEFRQGYSAQKMREVNRRKRS